MPDSVGLPSEDTQTGGRNIIAANSVQW